MSDQQLRRLNESFERLGERLMVAVVWYVGAVLVAEALRMAVRGEVEWAECAVFVVMIVGVCRVIQRLGGALHRWVRRDSARGTRKPLRETPQGQAAVWLFERGVAATAVDGVFAVSFFGFAVITGASSRVERVLPVGASLLDVLVVGAIAWFGARTLDSLWTVTRAAIMADWKRDLDVPHRPPRPPLDAD